MKLVFVPAITFAVFVVGCATGESVERPPAEAATTRAAPLTKLGDVKSAPPASPYVASSEELESGARDDGITLVDVYDAGPVAIRAFRPAQGMFAATTRMADPRDRPTARLQIVRQRTLRPGSSQSEFRLSLNSSPGGAAIEWSEPEARMLVDWLREPAKYDKATPPLVGSMLSMTGSTTLQREGDVVVIPSNVGRGEYDRASLADAIAGAVEKIQAMRASLDRRR